jgi:hypothetical protein
MKRKEAKRIARALTILLPQWRYAVWRSAGENYSIQVWGNTSLHAHSDLGNHTDVFQFIAKFGPRDDAIDRWEQAHDRLR